MASYQPLGLESSLAFQPRACLALVAPLRVVSNGVAVLLSQGHLTCTSNQPRNPDSLRFYVLLLPLVLVRPLLSLLLLADGRGAGVLRSVGDADDSRWPGEKHISVSRFLFFRALKK